jgi:hypothetical protein
MPNRYQQIQKTRCDQVQSGSSICAANKLCPRGDLNSFHPSLTIWDDSRKGHAACRIGINPQQHRLTAMNQKCSQNAASRTDVRGYVGPGGGLRVSVPRHQAHRRTGINESDDVEAGFIGLPGTPDDVELPEWP